jgi:hypothetical protein
VSASILSCPIYVLSPSNRWDGWGCPNICPICPIFLVVVAVRGFCRGVGGVTTYVSCRFISVSPSAFPHIRPRAPANVALGGVRRNELASLFNHDHTNLRAMSNTVGLVM